VTREDEIEVMRQIWGLYRGDLSEFRPSLEDDEISRAISRTRSLPKLQRYLVVTLAAIRSRN